MIYHMIYTMIDTMTYLLQLLKGTNQQITCHKSRTNPNESTTVASQRVARWGAGHDLPRRVALNGPEMAICSWGK